MHTEKYPTQEQLCTDIVPYSIFDNRVIVTGSRSYVDYTEFSTYMDEIIQNLSSNTVFYTGMATDGPEEMIIRYCMDHNLLYQPQPIDWDKYGRGAGYWRNELMVSHATRVIAFIGTDLDPLTKNILKSARDREIDTTVINTLPVPEIKNREIKIYSTHAQHRDLVKNLGMRYISIDSVQGIECFIPSARDEELLFSNKITHEQYIERYKSKMQVSQVEHIQYWERLDRYDLLVFGCGCDLQDRCHRHTFVQLATEFLTRFNDSVINMGEYTPESTA